MRYITIKPEERASIEAFRANCVSDNVHIIIRKRAAILLQFIVEDDERRYKFPQAQYASLLRRGFIRPKGNAYVHTELGLLALAFAVMAGTIRQSGGDVIQLPVHRKARA